MYLQGKPLNNKLILRRQYETLGKTSRVKLSYIFCHFFSQF
jgi:hypothetical protein